MANSKRQTLLNYIRDTTLAAISTGSGYNFTPGVIERGLREIDAYPLSKFPLLFLARTVEERENLTQNQFLSKLTAVIVGYVKTSTGVAGTQVELDKLIEDVTKALETDRLQGGNAKWTEVKRVVTDDGDLGDLAACAITVEFDYVSEGVTP